MREIHIAVVIEDLATKDAARIRAQKLVFPHAQRSGRANLSTVMESLYARSDHLVMPRLALGDDVDSASSAAVAPTMKGTDFVLFELRHFDFSNINFIAEFRPNTQIWLLMRTSFTENLLCRHDRNCAANAIAVIHSRRVSAHAIRRAAHRARANNHLYLSSSM